MNFEEFARHIGSGLYMSPDVLMSDNFEALGVDSIQLLEMDILIEELGVLLPEAALAGAASLRDLYESFVAST